MASFVERDSNGNVVATVPPPTAADFASVLQTGSLLDAVNATLSNGAVFSLSYQNFGASGANLELFGMNVVVPPFGTKVTSTALWFVSLADSLSRCRSRLLIGHLPPN